MAKRKTASTTTKPKTKKPIAVSPRFPKPTSPQQPAIPPSRVHSSTYHYPLLLDDEDTSKELLAWFERIEEARSMPWRKKWLDPVDFAGREAEFEQLLGKRAYEVWVSETRVSTVIPYFNAWISKWPTVQSLAAASHADVLSVWKGLGYYSRATRLHEGAQTVSASSKITKIPSGVTELQKIPGIGRYTAGAVSSIAFGEAEPVLDGNVARVLSRQLGLYVDVKDKKSGDVLWEVADQLVKSVAGFPDVERSRVPGQWNQALMELGSTICTPRPKCDECPIRKTCRAYAEGEKLALKSVAPAQIPDIEDSCALCLQLDTEDLVSAPEEDDNDNDDNDDEKVPQKSSKRRKPDQKQKNTISHYFLSKPTNSIPTTTDTDNNESTTPSIDAPTSKNKRKKTPRTNPTTSKSKSKSIATYCSLFPKKIPKKKVAEEAVVVCLIEAHSSPTNTNGGSKWLIEQRPTKGLLASLWQFPQSTLPLPPPPPSAPPPSPTPTHKVAAARTLVSSLVGPAHGRVSTHLTLVSDLGALVHVFSHLRLTMHVLHWRVETGCVGGEGEPTRKWVDGGDMDGETLSTGMRRCWELVRKKV